MLDWIMEYSDALLVFANAGTLIIWLVYAQLLYLGFRRQRRPRLIVNRGKSKDIEALCIISNMSAESVFIEYIIAELETSRGKITMDVTDFEQHYRENEDERSDDNSRKENASRPLGSVGENTRQGPMPSGSCSHIGTFNTLIKRLARDAGIEMEGELAKGDLKFCNLTIRLIAIYGPEGLPVGAERTFKLQQDGGTYALMPLSWDTRSLASRWQRYKLAKYVQQLNESNFTSSSRRLK